MKRRLVGTVCFIGVLFIYGDVATAAWIHYGPIGWGSPSVGRGGAEVAVADNCAVLTVNPAGMTQIDGDRFDFGGAILIPRMRFRNPYTKVTHDIHRYPFPEIGYVSNLEDSPWAFGVGLYANSGGGWDYDLQNPFFPGTRKSTATLMVAKAIGAAAYQVNEDLSVGFALDVYRMTIEVKSPLGPGIYLNTEEPAENYGYGFALGFLYKLHPKLTLGLNFTSQSWVGDLVTRDTVVTFSPLSPWGSKFSKKYNFKMASFGEPHKISLGLAYRPTERILFALDIDWMNLSQQWEKFKLRLTGDTPEVVARYPFRLRDNYNIQLGVDYTFKFGLTIRAGYSWSTDVLKDRGLFWIPIIEAVNNIGVGVGYQFNKMEIHWAWNKCFTMGEDSDQTALPQPDFNNAQLSYGDQYFSMMVSWHFR